MPEQKTVTVTIQLHGGLRRAESKNACPERSFQLILPKRSKLSDVLLKIGLAEEEQVLLSLNGSLIEVPEEKEINSDSSISIFPLAAGG